MNQHISSMLEHFTSLRRKNSESAQASSNDKHNATTTTTATELDQKDVNDVETMSSKTRSIFKDLMSDNGATNIFQNLNFIKCTSTASTTMSSPSNGTCKKQQQPSGNHDDDNNNQNFLLPTVHENSNGSGSKKRNSIAVVTVNGNCDLDILREMSPPPQRTHRKSAHDIRLLRSNHDGEKFAALRPLKTKNIITSNESLDTLHYRSMDVSSDE
jgi:hypothetical protein